MTETTKAGKTAVILRCLAVLLLFLLLFAALNRLVAPKYMTSLREGSMLSQYYREYGGHDVIFIGDCEVYANISPMELYRTHGITAYVRGTSQQLVWQSYYVLKETLTYETPKAVVWNVNAMRYGTDADVVKEEYNRLAMDRMRWSDAKIGMLRASMTPKETALSYLFPILRYHDRLTALTEEDFTYFFSGKDNTWNGHLVNTSVKPVESLPMKRPLADPAFPDICYDYLDRMRTLCEEHGVELILMKAPSLYPYWYEEYDEQIRAYADRYGLVFYNFPDRAEELGIDYQTDTYDGGYHLNEAGAKKLSAAFAELLAERHGIPDRRGDAGIRSEYDDKLARYDQAIADETKKG